MARRPTFTVSKAEEDHRPIGGVRFADPSYAEYPRHIHTFNEPESHPAHRGGEHNGIRTQTGNLSPWETRRCDGGDPYEVMNRKRGLAREED